MEEWRVGEVRKGRRSDEMRRKHDTEERREREREMRHDATSRRAVLIGRRFSLLPGKRS